MDFIGLGAFRMYRMGFDDIVVLRFEGIGVCYWSDCIGIWLCYNLLHGYYFMGSLGSGAFRRIYWSKDVIVCICDLRMLLE